MVFNSLFISVTYSSIKAQTPVFAKAAIGINIIIDMPEFELPVILHWIKAAEVQWMFSLSESFLQQELSYEHCSNLCLLFSFTGNIQQTNNIIPVFTKAGTENAVQLTALQHSFIRQGNDAIRFPLVDTAAGIHTEDGVLFCAVNRFEKGDTALIDLYRAENIYCVILLPDRENGIDLEQERLMTTVTGSKPLSSMLEMSDLRLELLLKVKEADAWKERAALYLTFIPLSKQISEKQYKDVLDWYQKEYEVLPLWYKRFGHIIKAVTGKRSFKSLIK